jgi:hypothetical protein
MRVWMLSRNSAQIALLDRRTRPEIRRGASTYLVRSQATYSGKSNIVHGGLDVADAVRQCSSLMERPYTAQEDRLVNSYMHRAFMN